jgi:hypothetical protein
MRQHIFLHFVDHEILNRLATANIAIGPTCERLVRIAVVTSPEPPLFPISAHHEEPAISQLLHNLDPMVRRDLLAITGNGATPQVNLDVRRLQFSQDRHLFAELFSSKQDHLVSEFSSAWMEKQGNTTRRITRWWGANAANPDSLLAMSLYSDHTISDTKLNEIVELPTLLEGRPLLADVVVGAIRMRRLIDLPEESLRRDLGAHLTRQWATHYCEALAATVFRDFGRGVPDMSIFAPLSFPTASVRRVELLLSELGCAQSILQLPIDALAEVLDSHRIERYYLAHDLFLQSTSGKDLWSRRRQDVLAAYTRQRTRSSIWLGQFAKTRPHSYHDEGRLDGRDVSRHVKNISNMLDCYAEASRRYLRANYEENLVDRSFHVSNVTGDVNVAQDSAVINSVRANSETLANRLLQATDSDTNATGFVEWLTANSAAISGDVDPEAIVATVAKAELSPEKKSLLRRIGESLAVTASSSSVVVAVIETINRLVGG